MVASEQFYSIEQVASQLGLHVRTVRNYVRDGRLKGVRIGKQYRVARADLDALTGRAAASAGRRKRRGPPSRRGLQHRPDRGHRLCRREPGDEFADGCRQRTLRGRRADAHRHRSRPGTRAPQGDPDRQHRDHRAPAEVHQRPPGAVGPEHRHGRNQQHAREDPPREDGCGGDRLQERAGGDTGRFRGGRRSPARGRGVEGVGKGRPRSRRGARQPRGGRKPGRDRRAQYSNGFCRSHAGVPRGRVSVGSARPRRETAIAVRCSRPARRMATDASPT